MAKIDNFSNEIQLSLNHIQSKIFEILGVDKQMVIISVQYEPNRSPKKSVFGSVIGVYLMSFFYEHPVVISYYFYILHVKTYDNFVSSLFILSVSIQNPI